MNKKNTQVEQEEVASLFPAQPEPLNDALQNLVAVTDDAMDDDEDFEIDCKKFMKSMIRKLPFKEDYLPPGIRENVQSAPISRKVETLFVSMPPLCALLPRVRLHYVYDPNRLHALLLQLILEGVPGVGKSFAADIVERIIGPTLEARDDAQRLDEQEYREKKISRTQNEKIGEAPKTTISCIPAATSKTVIVKRADYFKKYLGDYSTFWMWAEELAQITDAGRAAFSDLRTIMRVAFDLGAKFGQDFASDNSYSAIADIRICSMFCATPQDVDDYMDKRSVMGGNSTRIILVQLEDAPGAKPAIFKPFTAEQQAVMDQVLERLMSDTFDADGNLQPIKELDTSWVDKHVIKWQDKVCKEVEASGSLAMDVFRKRASVNAFRCMGLCYYLYHLENKYSEEQIQKLCIKLYQFMATYNLNALMKRWGAAYEEYHRKRKAGASVDNRKPLFQQCTETFTREQLIQLIKENDMDTDARFFLSQWKANKWIEKVGKNVFHKLI